MRRKEWLVLCLGFSLYCFFISSYLFQLYTEGDQEHYTEFYNTLHHYSLIEGYEYYRSSLGASEPIYFALIYFFNTFISKSLFFSFLNAVFGFILSRRLLKIGMHPMLLILVGMNFYFLVLLIPAERLKVSLLFFLFSISDFGFRSRISFLILGLLSHFQTFLLMAARFKETIKKFYFSFKLGNLKNIIKISTLLLLLLFIPYYFKSVITDKLTLYSENGGVQSLFKPIFFLILNIFYARKDKFAVWIMHLPIIISAFFIGDSRIVIFSFAIFAYYALQYKRGINLGILLTFFYFTVKGVEFIMNVQTNGEAF